MKKTVILIVTALFLAAAGCASEKSTQSGARPFDYYADCTTQEQILSLKGEPFVERLFPFTISGLNTVPLRTASLRCLRLRHSMIWMRRPLPMMISSARILR